MGHAIRDAANLIAARQAKKERRKGSSSLREEEEGKSTGLEEESKRPSRYDDDDDIFYEAEAKQAEAVDHVEEDPFVRHINQVLGPMPQREESRDPLREFLDGIGKTG